MWLSAVKAAQKTPEMQLQMRPPEPEYCNQNGNVIILRLYCVLFPPAFLFWPKSHGKFSKCALGEEAANKAASVQHSSRCCLHCAWFQAAQKALNFPCLLADLSGVQASYPARGHRPLLPTAGIHASDEAVSTGGVCARFLRRAAPAQHPLAQRPRPATPLQLQSRWSVWLLPDADPKQRADCGLVGGVCADIRPSLFFQSCLFSLS